MTQPQNTSTFAWIERQKWILVVAAIIAVVVTAYWYFSSYRPKSEATEYIAKLLHDPESAQFQDVSAEDVFSHGWDYLGRDYIVCGEVNGKNLYGAYTGFKPFVYLHSGNKTLGTPVGFIGNELPEGMGGSVVLATARLFKQFKAEGDTKVRKCNLNGIK